MEEERISDDEMLAAYKKAFAEVSQENKKLRDECKEYRRRLENISKMADCTMKVLDYALSMYGEGDIG